MFRQIDLKVDSEGDLVIDDNVDLQLATSQETIQQNILFRIKTDHLDYGPSPYIGANLSSFIAAPNTRRKAQIITEAIGISMQRSPDVPPRLLFIDAVPIGPHSIAAIVMYFGAVDGTRDTTTIVQYVIEKTISGVDNESIVNTTEL